MGKLDGKVAVITGATSGMALAGAEAVPPAYVNGIELVADGGTTVI